MIRRRALPAEGFGILGWNALRRSAMRGLVLMFSCVWAVAAHGQTEDPLQALKDSLSGDQSGSLLQGVLGKGDGTGKKTDKKLESPETVQSRSEQSAKDLLDKSSRTKTRDGRILRQGDEDPELRADDTVLIELTPVEDICARYAPPFGASNTTPQNGLNGVPSGIPTNTMPNLGGAAGLGSTVNNGAAGVGGISGLIGANGNTNTTNNSNNTNPLSSFDFTRCPLQLENPKSDKEKADQEKFRQLILAGSPYQLDRFGVLEMPGLPAMPLAGLTASEATKRLGADPDLRPYSVRLTLLRLLPAGDAALKPFGYDLFEGVPSTFAPVSDIQVPIDYVIGPGDTFDIQLYGNETSNYELTVERDGRINFPKLGPLQVSGLSFDSARALIEARVAKQMVGTRVSVTMGDLRSIRVFVLGEARNPGSYTVSGLSTMTNALFVSGGVRKIGSLRNIELKRNGRLVSRLDLYDLLLHGDTSADRQLMPGDVIFIPPIGETIAVDGAVQRPAIYELKHEKTAAEAVAIAGGLKPDADSRIGQLDRILPSGLRQMRNVDLTTAAGRATDLDNGDKLTIPAIRPTLEKSVELTGYVFRPGKFEYRAGLRLSDVLGSFDELRPNADLHYIMIRREMPPEERVEVISADLTRALAARGTAADPELKPRDQITVFNLSSARDRIIEPVIRTLELQRTPDKPEQVVSIDGRVKAPGRYPLEPTMHVSDLIRAGGSLDDAAYRGGAEITRYGVVDGTSRQTELIAVDLAAIRRGDPGADILLQPYDILVIKPLASWAEPGFIEVQGQVRFPGKYPIHQGETLGSVLHRAGGFTDVAFPEGAVYTREELKQREKEQMELLANRLQSDLAALSLQAVAASATAPSAAAAGAGAGQGLLIGQQLLSQLRTTKPVGRLVIDVNQVYNGRAGGPNDVLLRDGDKLLVPKKTEEITILGEVQSPTSHVFEQGLTRDDYIAKSGGTTQKADKKRIYVVRANGDVSTANRGGWFRRSQKAEIRPGDTIVVPIDTERVPALPIWQSVTTIIYNLAIALLAINSVK
jgi:polysaccharide biosynthesis/export protein